MSQVSPAVVHVPGVLARGDEGREGVTCSGCARERGRGGGERRREKGRRKEKESGVPLRAGRVQR